MRSKQRLVALAAMAGLFSLPLDTRAMPFTEERLQLAGGLA
jgi:hypothetical protein